MTSNDTPRWESNLRSLGSFLLLSLLVPAPFLLLLLYVTSRSRYSRPVRAALSVLLFPRAPLSHFALLSLSLLSFPFLFSSTRSILAYLYSHSLSLSLLTPLLSSFDVVNLPSSLRTSSSHNSLSRVRSRMWIAEIASCICSCIWHRSMPTQSPPWNLIVADYPPSIDLIKREYFFFFLPRSFRFRLLLALLSKKMSRSDRLVASVRTLDA